MGGKKKLQEETVYGLVINRKLGKSNAKRAEVAVDRCDICRGWPAKTPDVDWNILKLVPPDDRWLHFRYPMENLVFSSGGSRGLAYFGAVKALEDAGILRTIQRFAGCSAGAITASLLAVGCSSQEMLDTMAQPGSYSRWLVRESRLPLLLFLPRLFSAKGLFSLKRFYRFLGKVIKQKVGDRDFTFSQLYACYGRELVIVVTNVSTRKPEYLSRHWSPDLAIRDAVRMSMSLPGIYQPVTMKRGNHNMTYVDGAMLNTFPLNVFDVQNQEKGSMPRYEKTLGFYLMSENENDRKSWRDRFGEHAPAPDKPDYAPNTRLFKGRYKEQKGYNKFEDKIPDPEHFEATTHHAVKIRNIVDLLTSTLRTMSANQAGHVINPEDHRRTVTINCGYFEGHVLMAEPDDRRFMIQQGYQATKRFLQMYVEDHPMQSDATTHSQVTSPVSPGNSPSIDDIKAPVLTNHSTYSYDIIAPVQIHDPLIDGEVMSPAPTHTTANGTIKVSPFSISRSCNDHVSVQSHNEYNRSQPHQAQPHHSDITYCRSIPFVKDEHKADSLTRSPKIINDNDDEYKSNTFISHECDLANKVSHDDIPFKNSCSMFEAPQGPSQGSHLELPISTGYHGEFPISNRHHRGFSISLGAPSLIAPRYHSSYALNTNFMS